MSPHAEELNDLLGPEIEPESRSPHEHDKGIRNLFAEVDSDGPKPLGGTPPKQKHGFLKSERPTHRYVAFLIARGWAYADIAKEVGYTKDHVGVIAQQDWCRDAVLYFLHEEGIDPLRKLLEGAALDSFFSQIELRDSVSTPPAVKAGINKDLMDRYLGKAPQTVVHDRAKKVEDPKSEANTLVEQLKTITEQIESVKASKPVSQPPSNENTP